MMSRAWTPSIVPNDETVYLVVDCYGSAGCVYREIDVDQTDLETVISDLMDGQYRDPLRVVAFNTGENWAQDVSEDVAREIRRRADLSYADLSSSIEEFVVHHTGYEHQLSLRLA